VLSVTRSRSKIVHVAKTAADVELRVPSIDKARALLGFIPQFDLREGMERTVMWYRSQMECSRA
jgi:dTDP-glucose 4,6-dehydratase